MIFQANHRTEILDALAIAKELKLKAVISGASEAWKVAAAIKEAGVPVIIAGTLNVPRFDYDPYDAEYANPARLHEAGVTVAIRSSPVAQARRLPAEICPTRPQRPSLLAYRRTSPCRLSRSRQPGS